MHDVGQARCKRLLVAGVLSAVLVACGQHDPVQMAVGGLPPALPAGPAPATSFQGEVASFDAGSGVMVVDVAIVWTPVLQADRHQRKVLVDAQTVWEPAPAELHPGDAVQVEAVEAVEGVWPAVKLQLFDLD